MLRQIYETADTQMVQQSIADKIEKALDCRLVKLRALHRLDYSAERNGKTIAYAEIKRRYNSFNYYPNVILSLRKVEKAREVHSEHKLPCIFFVQFNDCLAWTDMLAQRHVTKGGRYDRNDVWDVEDVVRIPMSEFTIISYE